MTASQVIDQLKNLPPDEQAKVRDWLDEQADETPELLAAIDAGVRSLDEKGGHPVTRDELAARVRRWAGGSR